MKREKLVSRKKGMINVFVNLWSGSVGTIYATHPSRVRVTVIEDDLQNFEEVGLLADRLIPQRMTSGRISRAIKSAEEIDADRRKDRS